MIETAYYAQDNYAILKDILTAFDLYKKIIKIDGKEMNISDIIKINSKKTKFQDKKNGRAGYYQADRRKIDVISPAQYGAFLQKRGRRR